jgi:hypothetical protein
MDAAVMPFPSEETTPPVTKTYFDIETSRAVLTMVPELRASSDQRRVLVGPPLRRLRRHLPGERGGRPI